MISRSCWVVCAVVLPLFAQQAGTTIPRLLPDSEDVVAKPVRAARAKLYDYGIGSRSMLDPPPTMPAGLGPPPPPGVILCRGMPLPELPIADSEAVIVGEVTNEQPFVTANQLALYTEYTVRVLDTVKAEAATPRKGAIAVIRAGGVARLPDDRVIEYSVRGDAGPLVVGQQHLFFLNYSQEADAYSMRRLWRIQDRVIKAVDPEDEAKASQFRSENDGRLLAEVVAYLKGNAWK